MKKPKSLINPTGQGSIRPRDVWGNGEFESPTVGSGKINKGVGLICLPGQPIIAPMDGIISSGKISGNSMLNYSFIEINKNVYKIILKYVVLFDKLNNREVKAGDQIGIAQDITGKYGYTIIPHVIMEYWIANNPTTLIEDKIVEVK